MQVSVGQTPRLELALQVAGVAEQVQVTADATVLDMSSTKTATTITAKVIEELPRGRTLQHAAPGRPGRPPRAEGRQRPASAATRWTAPAAPRTCSSSTAWTSRTSAARRSAQPDAIPFEFVQEVQVKSGGFDAEFGGALGGVVNVVSKSGTDVYRGEVIYQFPGRLAQQRRRRPPTRRRPDPERHVVRRDPDDQALAEFFQPPEDDYSEPVLRLHHGRSDRPASKLRFFVGYIPQLLQH